MPKKKFNRPVRISFFTETEVKEAVEDVLGKVNVTMSEFLNICLGMVRDGKINVRPAYAPRAELVRESPRQPL